MLFDQSADLLVPVGERDFMDHRIGADVDETACLEVFLRQTSGPADAQDRIGIRQQILGGSAAETEPFFISVAAPVAPAAGEPEAFSNVPHVGHGIIRIAHPCPADRVIGPRRCGFQVVDIVAKAVQPLRELHFAPGDPRVRFTSHRSEYNNPSPFHVTNLPALESSLERSRN